MDDSQDVEQYDGTLGVSRAFVAARQRAVGQIQWNEDLADRYEDPGDVAGARWCSGTLIWDDLFLTAGHCFDQNPPGWVVPRIDGTSNPIPRGEISTNMHVNFNFQRDPQGNLREERSFPILGLVEDQFGGLDYAVVRVGGKPARGFGLTPVSPSDAAVADTICIIGHPLGNPKRVEAGPVTDFHDTRIGYNDIDTAGGNSGSGILFGPAGTIVGVHTNGGCDEDAIGHNHGRRISALLRRSATLRDTSAAMDLVQTWCSLY